MIAAAADVLQWNHTLINNTLNKLLMKKEEIKKKKKLKAKKKPIFVKLKTKPNWAM